MSKLDLIILDAREELQDEYFAGICRANLPTWVMMEVMNQLHDDDLEELEIDITDVASAVLEHIEGGLY